MIEFVREACRILTQATTATEAAKRLGTVEVDYGGALQIVLRPREPAFMRAEVMRAPGGEEPYAIELVPADERVLSVAALGAAFGAYATSASEGPGAPPQIVFGTVFRARPGLSCALVVEVLPGSRGIDDGTARKLLLRRDHG